MVTLARIRRMARTYPGRWELGRGVIFRLWPVLSRLAFVYRRTALRRTRLVVVSGSLGKTSARRATSAALGEPRGQRTPFNQFGFVALNLLAIPPWRRVAVLEVGIARPGEMRLYGKLLAPDVAVITSVASEHGSSLGDLDATAREKLVLARSVRRGGVVVLNGDDLRTLAMRDALAEVTTCVTYGFGEHNQVRALEAHLVWPEGTRLVVRVGDRTVTLTTRWMSRPMVMAVLAGLAIALAEGVDPDEAARRIEALPETEGRFQRVPLSSGAIVLRDDIKSPLESVREALSFLGEIPARRRFLVLGSVNEPPESQVPMYRALGEHAGKVADRVLLVCEKKTAQRVASGLRAAGLADEAVTRCGNSLDEPVEILRRELQEGDVVLIKGRGERRLERMTLALTGREVRCALRECHAVGLACSRCPLLANSEYQVPGS